MLSLKTLREYDIKDLDLGKAIKFFQERRDVAFNIAIFVAAIFVANLILGDYKTKQQALKNEIIQMKEKNQIVSEYKENQNHLEQYTNALPEGINQADDLISKINDFAVKHNLQITSFTPRGKESLPLYDKIGMTLNFTTTDYRDAALFVSDIENSNLNLRAERWQASIARSPQNNAPAQPIDVEIDISAIKLKK